MVLIVQWINNGFKETAEEMATLISTLTQKGVIAFIP